MLPITSAAVSGLPDPLDALILTAGLHGIRGIPESVPACPVGIAAAIWLDSMSSAGTLPPGNRTGVVLAGGFWPTSGEAHGDDAGGTISVWRAFRKCSKWVVGVAGDGDLLDPLGTGPQSHTAGKGLFLLDGDSIDVDALTIGGFGAGTSRTDRSLESDDCIEASRLHHIQALETLSSAGLDILVLPWAPPTDSAGRSRSPELRRCLEDLPPTVVVSGLPLWDSPLTTLQNGTQVLNVTNRVVALRRRSGK